MKATRHNGRSGKHGTYDAKHNDRRFDVENSEHIDAERTKMNVYWDCYQGYSLPNDKDERARFTFTEIEKAYYVEKYSDHVDGQNERNRKARHYDRVKTIDAILENNKTCPEETLLQLGNMDGAVSADVLAQVSAEYFEEFNRRYGSHVHILDWALHLDEATPHIHERHVFDAVNQYGELCPQQDKALEELGFELPKPNEKKGKYNNRKMVFDEECRKLFISMIEDWFRGILTDGILSNLSGLFDSVNTEVGEIATQVGTTPAGWNAGIFNMIRSLSENVIVPIAGVIITFVMCYELIQLVIEKNNLHDLDTWIFFKWIFKTFVAVLLVTNTWNIVMGVFDITQSVVNDSAGVIISDTSIDIATVITDIEAKLDAMSVGGLLGLWFQSLFVGLTMKALSICIMLVVYGRMIEIYLVTSIAPIPVATMVNREWGGMGQNYLKSLLALGFQAFLILVCVGIYAVLIQTIAATDDISGAIWSCMGYTVLLCFTLFKTGSLAKSVFSAH